MKTWRKIEETKKNYDHNSLITKTRQPKQKSDQEAKEPVEKPDDEADSTCTGGANACNTKFGHFPVCQE